MLCSFCAPGINAITWAKLRLGATASHRCCLAHRGFYLFLTLVSTFKNKKVICQNTVCLKK